MSVDNSDGEVEVVKLALTAHDKDPLSEHLNLCFRHMNIRCKRINDFKDVFKIICQFLLKCDSATVFTQQNAFLK